MKTFGPYVLLVVLSHFFAYPVFGAETKEAPQESAAQAAAPMSPAEKKKLNEQREREAKAKEALNGSSWDVVLKPQGSKEKPQDDVFTFQDTVFNSKYFMKRGYQSTNYSVTEVGGDSKRMIFETMLSSKDGVTFVRGEWENEVMDGQVTEQLEGGKKILSYYFSTNVRKAIPASSEKKADKPGEDPTSDGGGALVSKEKAVAAASDESVASFRPGTTEEV